MSFFYLENIRSCFEKYLKEAQGTNGLKQLEKWKVSNSEVEDLPPQLNKLAYICLRLLQNARFVKSLLDISVFKNLALAVFISLLTKVLSVHLK